MSELLTIELVKVDADLQAREALNADTVTAYAAHLIEGGELPPIVVFREGAFGEIWLGDGFHRRAAYVQAGRLAIPADVRKGSRRDAFLYALGANEEHGLRRTNADRRRAVTLALSDPELGKLGNRPIAKICKVSHPFVATVRAALSKPESSLDEIDLWEGERDPDAQVKRILDCADVAECEALLGAAGCVVRELLECSNHRQELRKIARAKLHADVAALFSLRVPGRREAALRRSQELALYEAGATGAEFDTLAKPAEWAKALQFKNLSKLDRMIGLIAQVLKVDSWGDVNNKPLLEALPDGCAFKGWVIAQCEKKAIVWAKEKAQHLGQDQAWPWPVVKEPEDVFEAQTEALATWIEATTEPELVRFWEWARVRTQYRYLESGYKAVDVWKDARIVRAARKAFNGAERESADCLSPDCEGFTCTALSRGEIGNVCWCCSISPVASAQLNDQTVQAIKTLIRRGLVTAADLSIEAAPVVEAPELETLPPAPVEAAPVVEAAPAYKVGWGADAEPAKRLCGRLQRAVKEDLTSAVDELKVAFTAWHVGRVVPSPLVKWVPAFDELGAWLDGRGSAHEVITAVRALVPALGAVTPPAVSDTDPPPPIAFADKDLWASAPLARAVIKSLTAYQGGCGKEDESLLKRALVQAAHWQTEKEPIPEGMPEEVLIVLQLAATEPASPQRVVDALAAACFAGPVALRWINNAEEDEPVKTTSPTGRAMKAIKDAELGAAAK
jgi:hypothetical protein